jgi:hypothetical protein
MSPNVPEVKDNVSLKMTPSLRDSNRLKPFNVKKIHSLNDWHGGHTPVSSFPSPSGENLPLRGILGQAAQGADLSGRRRPGGCTPGKPPRRLDPRTSQPESGDSAVREAARRFLGDGGAAPGLG